MHIWVLETLPRAVRPTFFLPPKGYVHQATRTWSAQHCHLVASFPPQRWVTEWVDWSEIHVLSIPLTLADHHAVPGTGRVAGAQAESMGSSQGTKGPLELEAGRFGKHWAPCVRVEAG